mmetsp:Transcript_2538/g.7531  ORF Transcript_2538/g.7531 Transcript_2538/m.7531 type:complete len:139 (-) Transcript_2538:201-617(-)
MTRPRRVVVVSYYDLAHCAGPDGCVHVVAVAQGALSAADIRNRPRSSVLPVSVLNLLTTASKARGGSSGLTGVLVGASRCFSWSVWLGSAESKCVDAQCPGRVRTMRLKRRWSSQGRKQHVRQHCTRSQRVRVRSLSP